MDFKQLLQDIQNVNPKDPGAWPWPVKILSFVMIFVAVVAGGYFADWQDQLATLDQRQAEEVQLKDTFLNKKKEAINLDLIRKQLLDTQQSFGALLKQLPNKSEMDALLTDINQAGLGRGLFFNLFKPGPEKTQKELVEQPITITVEGSFDDLGKFASDVSQLPRIVILTDISINPSGQALTMNATAKTYRYLDENEQAAQRAAGAKK